MDRQSKIERSTRETKVTVKLNADGKGKFNIDCEVRFLKHMVETLARYASFDIEMTAVGDNEHHIVEDCAITIGKAIREAVAGEPIERMASAIVPMDDALVMVSLDLADRPYAEIDVPDPMYVHFFRSMAMSSGMTLHILTIRGIDEHHLIEAAFKATGKALASAVRKRDTELSTKDREVIGRCSRRESFPAWT